MGTNAWYNIDMEEGQKSYSPKNKRQSQAAKHATIVDMKTRGFGTNAIAEAVNMPVGTVKSIIHRFKPIFQELENVGDYRNIKAELLSAGQLAALKSAMSPAKVAKAGYLSTLQGFEILNKAERLENNQSTENISNQHFGKVTLDLLSNNEDK